MTAKIAKVHCNKCAGDRRHEVLHEETVTWNEEFDDGIYIDGGDAYSLLKCCGCESVTLRHQKWFSEDTDVHGRPNVTTAFYPPESYRLEPRWLSELFWVENKFIEEFIKEIYTALRNKSLRMAVMGIRAILEQVMIDKVEDHGTFKGNLDAFEKEGFISKSQRNVLEAVLEAGHATMHRAFRPSAIDVGNIMDITESIIESLYINTRRALELSMRVPAKKK